MIRNRLSEKRNEGISLEGLARKIGIEKSYLWKIEKGLRIPRYELMLKLAKYFNCKVEDLFYLEELEKS